MLLCCCVCLVALGLLYPLAPSPSPPFVFMLLLVVAAVSRVHKCRPLFVAFRTRLLGKVAALVNLLCFLNASLGVCLLMALINLFVRPFSAATVRRLVSDTTI